MSAVILESRPVDRRAAWRQRWEACMSEQVRESYIDQSARFGNQYADQQMATQEFNPEYENGY